MAKVAVSVSLPSELVQRMDELRGNTPRSALISRALVPVLEVASQ